MSRGIRTIVSTTPYQRKTGKRWSSADRLTYKRHVGPLLPARSPGACPVEPILGHGSSEALSNKGLDTILDAMQVKLVLVDVLQIVGVSVTLSFRGSYLLSLNY